MNAILHFIYMIPPATAVAFAGKLFVDAAGTMPPPSEDCGYFTGWTFDLIQVLAGNSKTLAGKRSVPRGAAPVQPAPPALPAPAAPAAPAA